MFSSKSPVISSPLVQAIEDAVLFGNVKEIDGVLDIVGGDESFPQDIRYGLEALRYFRVYYGKGGVLEAEQDEENKQVAMQMETFWSRELIQMISHYPDRDESKYA